MQNFFAQSQPQRRSPTPNPSGFTYLHHGWSSNVYLSSNGTTVLKVFTREVFNPQKEYQLLQSLAQCAPDYAPAPLMFTRVKLNETDYLALQMHNAGNAIAVLGNAHQMTLPANQRLQPLTPQELALCILQSIHCVLLIKDSLYLNDVTASNMCVQFRGEDIRLRFIDAGLWEMGQSGEIVNNANTLFWGGSPSVWYKILDGYIGDDPFDFLMKMKGIILSGMAKSCTRRLTVDNVYTELGKLTEEINTAFHSQPMLMDIRVFRPRVDALVEMIRCTLIHCDVH